jgi:hypothetical protein
MQFKDKIYIHWPSILGEKLNSLHLTHMDTSGCSTLGYHSLVKAKINIIVEPTSTLSCKESTIAMVRHVQASKVRD